MGAVTLGDIAVTQLRRIQVPSGDVLHAVRRSEAGFVGFGEAYFSWIEPGAVKAWKRHRRMTLNLVVPIGSVRFVFFTDAAAPPRVEAIGEARYARLTVPPGIWFGFQGCGRGASLVLNVADIEHDPSEVERQDPVAFPFAWEQGT